MIDLYETSRTVLEEVTQEVFVGWRHERITLFGTELSMSILDLDEAKLVTLRHNLS